MAGKGYSVAHIKKEALKFASAHMTVFPDGTKESLHGHNYRTQVSIHLNTVELSKMIPFGTIKAAMKKICDEWDEKVLLASACPFYKPVSSDSRETEFTLCGKRYVLPTDEIVFINRDNITTETLSSEFCCRLIGLLDPRSLESISGIEIRIDEMTGQGASYIWKSGS
jgi:6-pyruvoyltetrahydropterin/6-carboxytetrahydropterin synthase